MCSPTNADTNYQVTMTLTTELTADSQQIRSQCDRHYSLSKAMFFYDDNIQWVNKQSVF